MKLAFLYTLASNQPLFAPYIATLERSGVEISHHVDESFLAQAREMSSPADEVAVTNKVHQAIEQIMRKDNPTKIICTCSTIGDMAESYSNQHSRMANTTEITTIAATTILRVDRPMADAAITLGTSTIHVLAALESTLKPTTDLIQQCLQAKNIGNKNVITRVVPNAWEHLQKNGNSTAYAQVVADYILSNYYNYYQRESNDQVVIVLAQASMSPAVDLLSESQTAKCPTILTSPGTCIAFLLNDMKGH